MKQQLIKLYGDTLLAIYGTDVDYLFYKQKMDAFEAELNMTMGVCNG